MLPPTKRQHIASLLRRTARPSSPTGNTPTACTDMNVTAGIRHVYRVKAINAAGVGPQSNYVRIEP